MFSLLNPLAAYLKLRPVRIYDGIFIFHSKVTVTLLLACTFLISAKQYFGDPIECLSNDQSSYVNNYCWTHGTFIINNLDGEIGKNIVAPGVRNIRPGEERIYQRYYQWVTLILIIQAIIFFIPSFLWKIWEGGRLQQLCDDCGTIFVPEDWKQKRRNCLVKYFSNYYNAIHLCYAAKYFLCELLNFIFCIINIFLMNVFFTGFWLNFVPALSVIHHNNWDEWNQLSSRVFPKVAKCDFYKFGQGGSNNKLDALCLLQLNILNEKVFAFLWFWFIILTFISGINIIYRIWIVSSEKFRIFLLRAKLRSMSIGKIRKILNNLNLGDWFILYKMSDNINPTLFHDLMEELYQENTQKKEISV